MKRLVFAAMTLLLGLLLTACASEETEPSTDVTDEFFTGSPDEFWQLMIACYSEHGIESHRNAGGLGVTSTLATEDFQPIQDECLSRIPRMPESHEVPEEQLRRMHAWRVEHYECMVDAGYLTGTPLSFDDFMDRRRETESTWSALDELNQSDMMYALGACPDSTNEW